MPNPLLLLGMLLMGNAAAATPSLLGVWGGDRHVLTVADGGATLQTDCAFAEFPPPATDDRGRFKVTGRFYPDTAGPQPGDGSATGLAAILEGTLEADRLVLTLSPRGRQPQTLTLLRGQRVRLIRCL